MFIQIFLVAIGVTWLLSLFTFAGFLVADWRWNEDHSCTQDYLGLIARLTSFPFLVVRSWNEVGSYLTSSEQGRAKGWSSSRVA